MLFRWPNDVLQLPVTQIVPMDNEHSLSVGSTQKVYIHMDCVLSDMSLIGHQLSHGFTMVTDSKHVSEWEKHYDWLYI